jgi:hypothetical protein
LRRRLSPISTNPPATIKAERSAVAAMRRSLDTETAQERGTTGAELSRVGGVPPSTGLGRRKRREGEGDPPEPFKATATAGR